VRIGELARLASLDRRDHFALLGRAELGTVAFAAVMAMGGIRRLCGLGLARAPVTMVVPATAPARRLQQESPLKFGVRAGARPG
jgi:hypothetical protein